MTNYLAMFAAMLVAAIVAGSMEAIAGKDAVLAFAGGMVTVGCLRETINKSMDHFWFWFIIFVTSGVIETTFLWIIHFLIVFVYILFESGLVSIAPKNRK